MTTIAYRDGVMAADTMLTLNDEWIMPHPHRKIERPRSGGLLGFAGNVYLQEAFRAWVDHPDKYERPDLGTEAKAIVVCPDGTVWLHQHRGAIRVEGPFCAIGCGAIPALAAMHMGADARRAVEIAALLDNATGGEIQVERLNQDQA